MCLHDAFMFFRRILYLLEAVFISQELQVLLQLEVVLIKEAIEGQLHVSELREQPGGKKHDWKKI